MNPLHWEQSTRFWLQAACKRSTQTPLPPALEALILEQVLGPTTALMRLPDPTVIGVQPLRSTLNCNVKTPRYRQSQALQLISRPIYRCRDIRGATELLLENDRRLLPVVLCDDDNTVDLAIVELA